jgi:hypothetical protein
VTDLRITNEKIAELLQQQTYNERMEMARWLRDPITDQPEEITTDFLAELIGLWADAELEEAEDAS